MAESNTDRSILTGVRIGITPTGWRNADFPDLTADANGTQYYTAQECLKEIIATGFTGCSDDRDFPKDAADWKAFLTAAGLPSGREFHVTEPWISTWFTTAGGHRRTLDFYEANKGQWSARGVQNIGAAEFGNAVHLRPHVPLKQRNRFSDQQWNALVEGLNELGRRAAADGFRLCYHPHMGTGVQTQPEMDRLMAGTDAAYVHLLLDTGHLTWAGGDPVAAVHRHGERIKHIHLKDLRPDRFAGLDLAKTSFKDGVKAGIFTVPGSDGKWTVPFDKVLKALDDVDYAREDRWKKTGQAPDPQKKWRKWLVVEAEQPTFADFHHGKTPKDYAVDAYRTVNSLLGGAKPSPKGGS
ncbi:TIM barrel protein [Nocardiopsis changdeensis]|uniref:TIM barrel protein n=1 Tax=Nocardiopsis changdeensis TaxID=2831969 RepID=A0ABX8BU95_9ACTN|nr:MULTISPECIES: TIM barrel protein [Nocardiopsis]QUX24328.1 TIM barrel protein [Nocardiopsis changdeensis]QYX34719.1 TIM barrel protein [Nocardiopsis sp. MT53]